MEIEQVPPLFFALFAIAWVAGLGIFVCLYLLTRRLGIVWKTSFLSAGLGADDLRRVGGLLYSGQSRLKAEGVADLVWAIRGCWLVMLVGIISCMIIMSGAA